MSSLRDEAERLIAANRLGEAIVLLRDGLSRSLPLDEALWALERLGRLHADRNEWQLAIRAFEHVLANSPKNGGCMIELAKAHVRLGALAPARALREALSGAHMSAEMHAENDAERIRLRILEGDRSGARQLLDNSAAHMARHPRLRLWRHLLGIEDGAGPLRILDAMTAPSEFASAVADTRWQLPETWFPTDRHALFVPRYNCRDFEDLGFVVLERNRPVLWADAVATRGRLSGTLGPIRILSSEHVQRPAAALRVALGHLSALGQAWSSHFLVADAGGDGRHLSELGTACLKRGATAAGRFTMEVELGRPESDLWKQLRKSYRPLVRAGQRAFRTRLAEDFSAMAELHGRTVMEHGRDPLFNSEPLIDELIRTGAADFLVGVDGAGRTVSATLLLYEGDTAVYFAARYARDAEVETGPSAVWNAILRAREKGASRLHLGVWDMFECQNAKMASIAFFKSGFTQELGSELAWYFAAPAERTNGGEE